MILTCPSCARRYLFDEKSFKEEKSHVRCAMCGYTWTPTLELFPSSPPEVLPIEALKPSFVFEKPAKGKKSFSLGALLFLVTFIIFSGLLIFARGPLIDLWPPLCRFYDLFSTSSSSQGLKLHNLEAHYIIEDQIPKLVITGSFVNQAKTAVTIPAVHITILKSCFSPKTDNRCPLQHLKFKVYEGKVLPGEEIHFKTPGFSPPPLGSLAEVEF